MQMVLTVQAGPYEGRVIRLDRGEKATLGRSINADESFPRDPRLSRAHFEVLTVDGRFFVRDLKSRNGIRLNAEKIESGFLADGDEIRAGQSRFTVAMLDGDIFDQEDWLLERRKAMIATSSSIKSPTVIEDPISSEHESHSSGGSGNVGICPAPVRGGTMVLATAALADMPQVSAELRILSGLLEGRTIPLKPGTFLRFGSGPNVDLSLPADPQIAAVHGTVYLTPGNLCQVEVFEPGQQLRINGKVVRDATWRAGEVLEVGSTQIVLALG